MKALKVYINPGVHPQFKEIIDFPPPKVRYLFQNPKGDHNSTSIRKKRTSISFAQRFLQLPRIANIKTVGEFDLIHSTRGILILNKAPWVIDLESGAAFAGLEWLSLKKPIMKLLINKYLSSPYCKKIMPQSEAAKRTLLENINCSRFEHKIETVYLAYHATKFKRVETDKVVVSFIGRGFYEKGGNDLQQAFKILNKMYPKKLELKMKCNVPEGKRLKLSNVKYIDTIKNRVDFYKEMFGKSNIYVQPTTVDSFGVSILEAMSTGLPIVCTDDFTLPELVEDGYNGFLVRSPVNWYPYGIKGDWMGYIREAEKNHPETVKALVDKVSILIEDPGLRREMGKNSYHLVEDGKFSIKIRNKKLRRIYEEAIV